jgi:hypothetical protein
LFKASAETMLTIAGDPKHLGARIGITSVLHTWGSALILPACARACERDRRLKRILSVSLVARSAKLYVVSIELRPNDLASPRVSRRTDDFSKLEPSRPRYGAA